MASFTKESLPVPPGNLVSGHVNLQFVRIVPGELSRGFVPKYHFRILVGEGADVGHINFRVGDTDHVRVCAGHIGFEVAEPFRGHGYALEACRAIAPFVRSIYSNVILTCDPDNFASMRTIERLGAKFVDELQFRRMTPTTSVDREQRSVIIGFRESNSRFTRITSSAMPSGTRLWRTRSGTAVRKC